MSGYNIRVEFPIRARRGDTRLLVVVVDGQGQEVYRDRADLNRERTRRDIAARVGQITGEPADSIEQRLLQGLSSLAPPPQPSNAAAVGGSPFPYEETPGGIIWNRDTPEGNVPTPLTTFTARIVGQVVEDDGAEVRRLLEIEAALRGRNYRFQVPSEHFTSMAWPMEYMGAGATLWPGFGIKDHARFAIQALSYRAGDPPEHRVYAHLGWRELSGVWCYLHAGGAIGPVGPVLDVAVPLPQDLERYQLPAPPTGAVMVDAIRASLRLLEAAEDRVTFPLHCTVMRAPLGGSDFGVHLAGATGVGKTELAALFQQHYGAGMDARHLPGSWLSTDNALEMLAFLTKDTLMTVDDFSPGGDHHKIQALHARADRLFRAQGNAAGRGRLRSDGTLRPTRPPRGLVLSTGEDVPKGQSLRARVLVLEVPGQGAGAVDWDKLTFCQTDAAAGLYAQAMAGFVRWLAPQYRDVRQRLKEEIASLRAEAYQSGQHPRTPDIVASLAVGLHYFLAFAQEVGALDEDEAATLWRRGWQALVGATESQKEHQASGEPTRRFLELLGAAIASGRVHLASPDGDDPEEAEAWGWMKVEVGTGQYQRTEWQPQGLRIGWIEDGNVYLEPEAAYAEVQKLARDGGDSLSVSLATLKRRLKEKDLLASTEKAAEREWLEVRRTLQGQRRKVLHLKASSFISEDWSQWSHGSQPSQGLYSAVPPMAPVNAYKSPVGTKEWSQDLEPGAGGSVSEAGGDGSIGSNGSKIPDIWSPLTATGLPDDGDDSDDDWRALDEQIDVLLDELDNAMRRWRHEHSVEAQQQVTWLEGQIHILGASVLIPLGEPHDPKLPVSQIEVCQDIATLWGHPSLVAAVSPDHQPKDGEVVGVLSAGGLHGGHVVRDAQVVVFRKSETPAVIGTPEGAHRDPWDPFLDEAGNGIG